MRLLPLLAGLVACSGDSGGGDSAGDSNDDGAYQPGLCGAYLQWDRTGTRWTYGLDPEAYDFTMNVEAEAQGATTWEGTDGLSVVEDGEYDIPDLYDYFYWHNEEVRFCDGAMAGTLVMTQEHERSSDGVVSASTSEFVYTGGGEWKVDPVVGDVWEADLSYDLSVDGEFVEHIDEVYRYEVVGERDVTVPAGDFTALEIDVDHGKQTLFLAEGVGLVMRLDGYWLEAFEPG
jgi:hypothetical protein